MNAIILLAISGVFSMFSGLFRLRKWALPVIILVFLAVLGLFEYGGLGNFDHLLNNMLKFGGIPDNFSQVIVFVSVLVLIMGHFYYRKDVEHLTDIYALFIFSVIGGILLVSFQNLVILFIGMEILSIPLYILAASNRKSLLSNEAGLKYFLMGAFFTCFLLLGITLIYGAYGSFDLDVIASSLDNTDASALFITGSILIFCALLFKLSAVPFQYYGPDVYQGAPTVLTAFLTSVVKIAIFGALLKVMILTSGHESTVWINLLVLVALATMGLGNIVSLIQTNYKRLLAYTGMANVGFVLMAVIVVSDHSATYILYNLLAYSIAAVLSFSIYSTVKDYTGIDTIEGLVGLAANNKLLAVGFIISLLSFAGIPPLAGFFGKYFILVDVINGGLVWLAVVAIVLSVLAAYNYLRIAAILGNTKGNHVEKVEISDSYKIFVVVCIVLLFVLGIFPDQVFALLS